GKTNGSQIYLLQDLRNTARLRLLRQAGGAARTRPHDLGRAESRSQAPGVQAHQGENATVRGVLVRAQRPSVVQRAGRLDGVLQALRTRKPLGAQEQRKKRCEESLERHDFEEQEGAKQWMRSNAPFWMTTRRRKSWKKQAFSKQVEIFLWIVVRFVAAAKWFTKNIY